MGKKAKQRPRKRLYSVRNGFRLVRDSPSRGYDKKHHDFIVYLWKYCPSGVLEHFEKWLAVGFRSIGLDVSSNQVNRALTSQFLVLEAGGGDEEEDVKHAQ